MALTKQVFMSKPKIRALPAAEKERRWKQHLMSEGGIRDQNIRGRGAYLPASTARGRARGPQRRPRRAVGGRGDYWEDFKAAVPSGTFASLGAIGGGALMSELGPPGVAAGGVAGGALGQTLASLVGFGDYDVKYNTIMHPEAASAVAAGAGFNGPTGSRVVISKRECLGAFTSQGDEFYVEEYRIQPINRETFPWLSQISPNFVEWRLHGCVFSFETTSSPYSAQVGLGQIVLATQLNSNALSYESMEQMLMVENKSAGNPSQDIAHGVECDPSFQEKERLYIRRKGSSGPPNLYDHGVFSIASEGIPADEGTVLGRLYVTYQLELDISELPPITSLTSGRILAVQGNFTSATDRPPLGPSLSLIGDDLGSGETNPYVLKIGGLTPEIELMVQTVGPLVYPNMNDISNGDLAFWFNDDSAETDVQYIGFRFSGDFMAIFTCDGLQADSHPLPSMEGADPSIEVIELGWFNLPEPPTTYNTSHVKLWKIAVRDPGHSVKLWYEDYTPSSGLALQTKLQITALDPIPNIDHMGVISGARGAHRRRAQMHLPPVHEPTSVDNGTGKGQWVETKVFVPDDAKTSK